MTKPKLTDAVKPNAAQTSEQLPAQTSSAATVAASGDPAAAQPAQGDKGGEPSGEAEPAATPAASQPAATESAAAATSDTRADSGSGRSEIAPNLAAYKAAFGDVQGCVYFAEGISYTDACTKHISVLNGQVADLTSKLEEATATNAKLAKSVLGSDEPLKTGNESAQQGNQFATKTDAYASVISDKLDKLKT